MQLTLIGGLLFAVALFVFLRGSTLALFSLLIACSLMGGSAALILPALGGASIPPLHMVLPFMAARILLAGRAELPRLAQAIRANAALLGYVGYGVAAAITAPRIFAGRIDVPPLRLVQSRYLFEAVRLAPSNQNITTSVYMTGTLLLAIAAFYACSRPGGGRRLVQTGVVMVWIHVFLGVSALLFGATPYGAFLDLFRNATYAQLDQSYGNFVRIKGIFPEASAYAGFGFVWFVFMFECWFRRVMPRRTGPAALAMFLVLVFSTSATAYVGLAAYLALIVLRSLLMPRGLPADRILVLSAALLGGIVCVSAAALLLPRFATEFTGMVSHMTVDKGASDSGLQRLFWARKGIEAFWVSHGIGIGPGSFRSSSLLTAILGSCGVAGLALLAAHVLRAFRPLRASTYLVSPDERTATGVAASWTMLAGLVPSGIAAPTADPGINFAIFSGCALALRAVSADGQRTKVSGRNARPGGRNGEAAAGFPPRPEPLDWQDRPI